MGNILNTKYKVREKNKPHFTKIVSTLLIGIFVTFLFTLIPVKAFALPFVSTWDTTKAGSASNQIVLPLESTGTYNFVIDWGDESTSSITTWNQAEVTHTYSVSTTSVTVSITGTINGWRFNNTGDRLKIKDISQWGILQLGNSNGYFYGTSNLKITATDVLNLTGTTNMQSAFESSGIDTVPSMNSWDVSNVTNMYLMFWGATLFNQDIGNWDVSNVTNMANMFTGASVFNQNIGNWNVSKVTNMSTMFMNALSFNNNASSSIGNWNVSSTTNMSGMFYNDTAFNQNIGSWNVSNVTDMSGMFLSATHFNQDIGNWDVSNVTDMSNMFFTASVFNQNIGSWNVSNVTSMYTMFRSAAAFNNNASSSIGNWNVSNVTNMSNMFWSDTAFNQDIGNWNVSKVTNMTFMFTGDTAFNQNLGNWNVSSTTNMTNMFSGVTLSTTNYSNLLVGWSALPLRSSVNFNGGNSKYYTGDPATARASIISSHSWTITDGGSMTSDYYSLYLAKVSAQTLITANAPESTTPGDHIVGSLATLSAALSVATATDADLQSVIDAQITALNAAIATYNAAIVPSAHSRRYFECTSWTYTDWSPLVCPTDGQQTRIVSTSLPDGCTGGSPVISQSCIATSTIAESTTTVIIAVATTTSLTIPGINTPVLPSGFCFTKNLVPYKSDADVKNLQIFLNSRGFGLTLNGSETNYYGTETLNAVISFQGYYKSEILTPSGLTLGTGSFGNYTRKKANSILGCDTIFETVTTITPKISTNTTIEIQQSTSSENVIPAVVANTENQASTTIEQNNNTSSNPVVVTETKKESNFNILYWILGSLVVSLSVILIGRRYIKSN